MLFGQGFLIERVPVRQSFITSVLNLDTTSLSFQKVGVTVVNLQMLIPITG